jgi:transcriptional regulator with XRE-family HTH domain
MDRLRLGRSIRVIRIRLGWRQLDLATAANVSRSFVSDVERGLIGHGDLPRLERLCVAVGADLDVRVRWRGEGVDRLLDESHADLVERTVELLKELGWETAVEVTFNEYGDRGSVDVLGWHVASRSLLVIEAKSVVGDAQATLMPLDRKTRLGAKIGGQLGWHPSSISRLLVVWEGTTNRRRVERLDATFRTAFPVRGRAVGAWLSQPAGPVSALLFLPDSARGGARRRATGRRRVNRPQRSPERPR